MRFLARREESQNCEQTKREGDELAILIKGTNPCSRVKIK